jgi:hypothetical protein
MISDPAAVVEL